MKRTLFISATWIVVLNALILFAHSTAHLSLHILPMTAGLEPLLCASTSMYKRYMNTDNYQRDEHRVHLITSHLIWCPRRRKPVLVGEVKARLEQLIREKGELKGWTILALAIQPDHLHLFVRCSPTDCAAEVVKECKGVTSFSLRKEFPTLRKLPSMWTRSYLASTAGNVSRETIERYIEAQKGV